MKPARFIFNSDYTTVRNIGHYEISYTIPDSFITPAHQADRPYVITKITKDIGEKDSYFEIYATSSRYDYASFGNFVDVRPAGAKAHDGVYQDNYDATISFRTEIKGTTAELETIVNNYGYQTTYTGYAQTITIHILTFKSPFSE